MVGDRLGRLGRAPAARPVADVGWASAADGDHVRSAVHDGAHLRDPVIRKNICDGLPLDVWRLKQVTPAAEWAHSRFHQEVFLPCGIDEVITSVLASPGAGNHNWLVLTRPPRGRPFERREPRLLRLVHREINPLLGSALAGPDDPCPSKLPPRLRETLDCLLDGDSEKQAALRLGVRRVTAHQYVNALYRHFGVAGRAELMAHFLRRYRNRRP